MQPTQPNSYKNDSERSPEIAGDSDNRIMMRSAQLVGLSRNRAVWSAGFLRGSEHARAYGVSASEFTWFLTDHDGVIYDEYKGFGCDLPLAFEQVLKAKLV